MNIGFRTRTAFHCQPAQHLLIDTGHPMTPEILKHITSAAENIITLASSLYGGVRIPEFGLSFLNNNYFEVLKFVKTRGNYPKILKSFRSLGELVKSNEKCSFQEFTDSLKLAICKILEEYSSKQNIQASSKEKLISQFVLITLVTLRDGTKVQEYMEEVLNTLSTEKLKKFHILQIVDTALKTMKSGTLVELTQISLNDFKLEQVFKHWLLDYDTSQEHVCIHLNNDNSIKEANIIIKCDVNDSMINPFLLPFGHFYQIQTDYFKGSGIIKFPAKHIPVYNLKVIKRISGSGLCESLLFGQPLKLFPTRCWQLEGINSAINQEHFHVLCKELLDKDEYLLVKSSYPEGNVDIPGHFVLIPGVETLLLRAVTPSELVLPNRKFEFTHTDKELFKKLKDNVSYAYSKLPLIDDFMQDTVSSNLYNNLKNNLTEKSEWDEEDALRNSKVDHPALDSPRTKLCLTKKKRRLL